MPHRSGHGCLERDTTGPNIGSVHRSRRETFSDVDYVVVGAGTAGCIVAARLAAAGGASVALVESGSSYRRVLDVPLLGLWVWLRRPDRYAWDSSTVPQEALGGRRVWFPGGRLVGGSSAINAMVCSRGHPASYDRWALEGWRYADLLPWFRRAERHERGASPFHGADGRIGVSESRFRHPLALAFLSACREAGIPLNDDFNGEQSDGAGFYQLFQWRGRRSCTATAYLPSAPRESLRLITRAHVTRLVLEGGRARGIEVMRDGTSRMLRARREVIVCAGTVRSPQLLMLSGIGPADALRRREIGVVADRPEVGENLRDQVRVPMIHASRARNYAAPWRLAASAVEYAFARRGLFASNVVDVAAIVHSTTSLPFPDIRLALRWRVAPEHGRRLVDIEVALLAPKSRGRVTLAPDDPFGTPLIDPAYLRDPADARTLARGMALARRIAGSRACRAAGVGEQVRAGPASDDEHLRAHLASAFHPVGTCRMGTDDGAVVDLALRVRAVEGLRVIDASVIPAPVSGNAQSLVVALAERGADLLLTSAGTPGG